MKVALFDFDLPADLIADRAAEPRDAARLLVIGEALEDRRIRELPELLRPGDLLVVNDTAVIPARLAGETGQARVEVTLLEAKGRDWTALARPAKRCRPGAEIRFAEDFAARIVARGEGGEITLRFDAEGQPFDRLLRRHGRVPLPPYIRRPEGPTEADATNYQTMFAADPGAVAAPTAGLHFTADLVERLRGAGVRMASVTLHVGAGTFLPVKVEDTRDHRMHSEWGRVPAETVAAIRATRAAGGRIVAVGTTSLRLLETAARRDGVPEAFAGPCDLFITPGFAFRVVDVLLTNFHLPRSTLFMLVCAFGGMDRLRAAYEHAKRARYRFYSFGDACLIERDRRAERSVLRAQPSEQEAGGEGAGD